MAEVRVALRERTCIWRFAKSGVGPLEIALMWMLCGWILRPRISSWLWTLLSPASVRTNCNVLCVWAPVPLRGIMATGGQQAKLDADIHPLPCLDTLSIQYAHDYYPFGLEDGGRLSPMGPELVDVLLVLLAI
jgi:hypothetical protein